MLLRSIVFGAALAAAAAAPASAVPTIDPLKPCYVAANATQRELVTVSAHGFTPLATIDVYLDDIQEPQPASALLNGDVSGMVAAPFVETGQRIFTLRLAEHDNPANYASAMSRVTSFSVEQLPKKAKTDQRVRFRGRGFTLPQPVYAHYVFGGKSKRTIKLGMPKAECGTFDVRRTQFPFKKRPRLGSWTIQFDQLPYYDPNAARKVPMTIKVTKTIKPRRARAH